MESLLLVTARTSSTRLPGKCLLPFGGQPLVIQVLQRAVLTKLPTILCTTDQSADDALANIAVDSGFRVFRGHPDNKLVRWSDCLRSYNAKWAHTIDCDDPFFNSDEVLDSLRIAKVRGLGVLRTSEVSDNGMASVGTTFEAGFLKQLADRTLALGISEIDVIPWDVLLEENDVVGRMPNRDLGILAATVRLTLDYPEDYEMLSQLVDIIGPEARRVEVEMCLAENPELRAWNAQRTNDFLERQDLQRSSVKPTRA